MTAVSSQLFVIDRTDPFSKNVLHYPPICAHLYKYINLAGASLYETSDGKAAWQAKLLRGGSFGVLYTGYVVNSLIALVETIVSCVHAVFAIVAFHGSSSPSREKYAHKASAHFFHSLYILGSQIGIMRTRHCLKERRVVSGYFHISYLRAALLGSEAGSEEEKQELIKKRAVMILMEALPARMPDIFRLYYGAERNISIQPPQEGDLETFSQHPWFKEKWETWLQSRTFENFEKMLPAYSLFLFLKQEGRLDELNELPLHPVTDIEAAYRESLKGFIRQAIEAMPKDKKELVKSMDADIVVPLALFAAFKEVEAPPCCPISFDSPTLRQYNGRFEIIEKARQALATLDAGEKEALTRKIFNEPFEVSAKSKVRIEALYTLFTQLAGPLYQGNLMSEQIMTIEEITTKSYFQEAVQNASL